MLFYLEIRSIFQKVVCFYKSFKQSWMTFIICASISTKQLLIFEYVTCIMYFIWQTMHLVYTMFCIVESRGNGKLVPKGTILLLHGFPTMSYDWAKVGYRSI